MSDNRVNSGLLEFSEDQKVFVALDAETSEVEKAVVIDEDGVETNFAGIVPTGNINITGTTAVNVTNYATAQVVDEDLVAGNIKKDVDILGVVGTYEPEASDFTAANVTLNNCTGFTLKAPVAMSDVDNDYSSFGYTPNLNTETITVIMYKGAAVLEFEILTGRLNTTGNIESLEDSLYRITGDCTIEYVEG